MEGLSIYINTLRTKPRLSNTQAWILQLLFKLQSRYRAKRLTNERDGKKVQVASLTLSMCCIAYGK